MSEANDNTLYSQGYVDALEAGIENAINERDEALAALRDLYFRCEGAGMRRSMTDDAKAIIEKHNRLPAAGGAE